MDGGEKKSRSLIFRSFGQIVRKVVRHVSSAADNTPGGGRKTKDHQRKNQNCSTFDYGPGQLELRGDAFLDGSFPGVVGIQNHGNTCFINAVIQCLSNTERLAGYFVTDRYRDDMQRSKKHGVGSLRRLGGGGKGGGEMTENLAGLVKSLWSCRYAPEVSGEFKKVNI